MRVPRLQAVPWLLIQKYTGVQVQGIHPRVQSRCEMWLLLIDAFASSIWRVAVQLTIYALNVDVAPHLSRQLLEQGHLGAGSCGVEGAFASAKAVDWAFLLVPFGELGLMCCLEFRNDVTALAPKVEFQLVLFWVADFFFDWHHGVVNKVSTWSILEEILIQFCKACSFSIWRDTVSACAFYRSKSTLRRIRFFIFRS